MTAAGLVDACGSMPELAKAETRKTPGFAKSGPQDAIRELNWDIPKTTAYLYNILIYNEKNRYF